MLLANFDRKEHLRHRAVSLRQHGFLVINTVICKLRSAGYGAYIGMYFFGCLLYTDDILLVSHSIFDMQLMLDICSQEADTLDFTFNTSKSVAIRIGPNYRRVCAPLHLCNSPLVYVDQVKYLGILLLSAQNEVLPVF